MRAPRRAAAHPRAVPGLVAVALLLVALVTSACAPVSDPTLTQVTPQPTASTAGPSADLQISTDPALFPPFTTSEQDYVARCDASTPITVTVQTPAATTVAVAGQTPSFGTVTAQVTRAVGQSFPIQVTTAGEPSTTYYVRCIPQDFPTWDINRFGTPQAQYYALGGAFAKYVAIVDTYGTPVWWAVPPSPTVFAQLLPNGKFAWLTLDGRAQTVDLDGGGVTDIPDPIPGTVFDNHDMLQLPNGHYVLAVDKVVANVDLSAWGPTFTTGTVLDHEFVELDGSGNVVWSWDTLDHIPVAWTDPQWQGVGAACQAGTCIDPYHWNSIEPTTEPNGDPGFVLSFRHLDAVVNVDKTTGAVVWRLGGTPRRSTGADGTTTSGGNVIAAPDANFTAADVGNTVTDGQGLLPARTVITAVTSPTTATISQPASGASTLDAFTIGAESLVVEGDPVFSGGSHFGGQHDARILSDGSLSLYDDGTNLGRAPRAVRYAIDANGGTATLLEDVSDPTRVPSSFCCGSSRLLSGGDRVVGWGSTGYVTEVAPDGSTVFVLKVTDGPFVYRGIPIEPGVLDPATLRTDMDDNSSLGAQAEASTSPPYSVGVP